MIGVVATTGRPKRVGVNPLPPVPLWATIISHSRTPFAPDVWVVILSNLPNKVLGTLRAAHPWTACSPPTPLNTVHTPSRR